MTPRRAWRGRRGNDPAPPVPRAARRAHGDAGQVGGIEVLPFGLLIFVVGALLVANAWGVVDAKLATTSAAREAVRAYVEAPDAAAALAAADQAARDTVAGHGRNPARVTVTTTHDGDRPYGRCTRAAITVRYQVPAIALPWIGGYGDAFTVTGRASEIVDPYRSGLPGEASC